MKRTGRNKRSIATLVVLLLSMIVVARGKRVLFIGDSITDGAWGNSKVWNTPSDQRNHKDMNHIYGHGYMMITASHYEALYPEAGWTFWNRGISGNTLDDLEGVGSMMPSTSTPMSFRFSLVQMMWTGH